MFEISFSHAVSRFLSFVDKSFEDPSNPGVPLASRMVEIDELTKDFIFSLLESGLDDCEEIPVPNNEKKSENDNDVGDDDDSHEDKVNAEFVVVNPNRDP